MTGTADPFRLFLDAVLAETHTDLDAMATSTYSSPFHFARMVSSGAGESPVAMRRRVLLERSAWQLQRGTSVTDAAFAAGYESLEGFSRAFARAYGHPPSATPYGSVGHWLPAANGVHFHSPTVLYVDSGAQGHEASSGDVVSLQVHHDAADIATLIEAVALLPAEDYSRRRLPRSRARAFDGPDESLSEVMWNLVHSSAPWQATIAGEVAPERDPAIDPAVLRAQHAVNSARWLATVRDISTRGAWSDRVVDALCDPPESFLLSQIVAHELTFSAHRRLLARWMLADAGVPVDTPALDPDPILWHRRLSGERS